MKEDPEQGGVEQRVEDPCADAAAPAADGAEVHPHDADVAGEVAAEEAQLAGERDVGGSPGGEPRADPEPVAERDGVRERGREDCQHLERLRELEPQERHGHGGGVREHPRRGAPAPAQHRQHAPRRVEVAGQVVGVGPEEDAARGARPGREAQEPPQRGAAAAAPPRPPRVPYLRHRRQQRPREDGGRRAGHQQRVRRGHGAQRNRQAPAQALRGQGQRHVQGQAERHVGGQRPQEERPGGEPQVRRAPPEPHDGRVLREPVGGGRGHTGGMGMRGGRRWLLLLVRLRLEEHAHRGVEEEGADDDGNGFGEERPGYI
jgi:hypothetical protein